MHSIGEWTKEAVPSQGGTFQMGKVCLEGAGGWGRLESYLIVVGGMAVGNSY